MHTLIPELLHLLNYYIYYVWIHSSKSVKRICMESLHKLRLSPQIP